jgi:N-acetylglucosamine-6-phosphate deacetylase
MPRVAFRGNIVLPDEILKGGIVVLEGENIAGVHPASAAFSSQDTVLFDYGTHYISPGLIDIHLHGALGKDVMDGRAQGLGAIAVHQARCGVTGFVPTTLAASLPSLLTAVESIKTARKLRLPSEILGIHLEGPFLNIKKKGAQNPAFIKDASAAEIDSLLEAARGLKVIISLAPEVGDNVSFVPGLKKRGAVVAIGHTEATYEQAIESFLRGITHATHLFNAMSGFQPREPGVIGAVLDFDKVTAEVIADGVHVHPASLRMAIRQKGVKRICLITDSMNAAGLGDGDFKVGGLDVVVQNGQARLKESSALAGSVLTLNRALKNILRWTGLSVSQAIKMASLTPAGVLGLDDQVGSIQPGKYADLAIFDEDFNVVDTIMRGRSILRGTFGISIGGHNT